MQHLLTLDDMSPADVASICANAQLLKAKRASTLPHPPILAGQIVALLFEKPSLRTRVSFEVAAREMGATSLYLSPQEVGLGKREAIRDVARVLSSYVHAVVIRTFDHAVLEEFSQYSSVPVINGLSDSHHPCQGLTDVFTIAEYKGVKTHPTLAYIGDGNNVAHSLIQAAMKVGIHMRVATPVGYEPDPAIVTNARADALITGGSLTLMHDPVAAARDADVLYTDVWASMGQESEAATRNAVFAPYRITTNLLSVAAPDAMIMHPLPAHRGEEITDEVIDGPHSYVFVQAENRLHLQKALLRHLLRHEQRTQVTSSLQASMTA
jgi:ornithine carbamoyltransferase